MRQVILLAVILVFLVIAVLGFIGMPLSINELHSIHVDSVHTDYIRILGHCASLERVMLVS